MRLVLVAIVLAVLAGCASAPAVRPVPRVEAFTTAPDTVLENTMAALAERGFVIVHGDQVLGVLDAEYAARPPWWVKAVVKPSGTGSRLELTGQHGRSALAPRDFDWVVMAVHHRLATAAP